MKQVTSVCALKTAVSGSSRRSAGIEIFTHMDRHHVVVVLAIEVIIFAQLCDVC